MGQISRNFPPIGEFDIAAIYETETPERGALSMYCGSAGTPITLELAFPDPDKPLEALSDLHAEGEASYLLRWPSEMTKDEVVDVMRQVGEGQVDTNYLAIILSPSDPRTLEELTDEDEGDEEGAEEAGLEIPGGVRKSSILSDAIAVGFDELSVESSDISLGWESNVDVADLGPFFSFMTANNYELTEPYVQDLVRRTIIAKHAGGVAASLENLNAIFEKYRDADPRDL